MLIAPGDKRRPVLSSLTGLRAVAALVVVLYHALRTLLTDTGSVFATMVGRGFVGVSLFFVLSGFILAYTYLEPDARLRGSARAFWWARVARVYPVYLLALAVSAPQIVQYALRSAYAAADRHDALIAAVATPLLLQAWSPGAACRWNCPGWSLSVEALFYLLFPVLAAMLVRRRRIPWLWVGLTAWGMAMVFPALYVLTTPDEFNALAAGPDSAGFWLAALKFNPVVHLGEFVLGLTGGLWFLQGDSGRRAPSALITAAGLLVLAILVAAPGVPYVFLHSGLLAPLFLVMILWLAPRDTSLLGSPIAVRLGEASYATYLLHVPIHRYLMLALRAVGRSDLSAWLWFPAYLIVLTALSMLVFRYVEVPARAAVRRWSSGAG